MKTFEYKEHMNTGKITVRTHGIELPESKGLSVEHLQKNGSSFNVYTATKTWLKNNIDKYWDFKPQFNWND